jgi:hypothetical protein
LQLTVFVSGQSSTGSRLSARILDAYTGSLNFFDFSLDFIIGFRNFGVTL